MHVVFAQNEAQGLNGNEVTSAGVAEDMSPTTRFFDVIAAAAGNGRTASGVDNDAIVLAKCSGQTRIAIAAGDDFRVRPNFGTET